MEVGEDANDRLAACTAAPDNVDPSEQPVLADGYHHHEGEQAQTSATAECALALMNCGEASFEGSSAPSKQLTGGPCPRPEARDPSSGSRALRHQQLLAVHPAARRVLQQCLRADSPSPLRAPYRCGQQLRVREAVAPAGLRRAQAGHLARLHVWGKALDVPRRRPALGVTGGATGGPWPPTDLVVLPVAAESSDQRDQEAVEEEARRRMQQGERRDGCRRIVAVGA